MPGTTIVVIAGLVGSMAGFGGPSTPRLAGHTTHLEDVGPDPRP
jgi:hypothetical protein